MSAQIVNFRPEGDHQWTRQAACADQGAPNMFPHDGDTEGIAEAKEYCLSQCPVQAQCLEAALEKSEQFGIWGGMDLTERRAVLRFATNRARRSGQPRLGLKELSEMAVDSAHATRS